jgi:D-lactate dehydrogenase (cytochrome)
MSHSALEALAALPGSGFNQHPDTLAAHAHDISHHTPSAPLAVCMPADTETVAQILKICSAHRLAVIPYGAGTSLEGHVIPVGEAITLDLSRMNRILRVSVDDLDCTVEAGLLRRDLDAALVGSGAFFPIGPGANPTVGGMASTRASGTNAVRYGTMREAVLGLTVVLASGEVLKTGSRARKSSAGYDLTSLFVGAEGTLGVITELTLKLFPEPEATASAVVSFPSVQAAVSAVTALTRRASGLARIELLDAAMMRAVNRYSSLSNPEQPTLFLDFHGSGAGVREQAVLAESLLGPFGASGYTWATEPEAQKTLWRARFDAYWAALATRPNSVGWTTDVCVPLSALAGCVERARAAVDASGLSACLLGHVGDGNFHYIFALDPANPAEFAEARRINDLMVRDALAVGGTSTGEHGVGTGKRGYVALERGEIGLTTMRALKQALDPLCIMNPSKTI